MRRSQKRKRVSWASDVNLCQVKFFLLEDSPSQVVLGTQDHLQEKALRSIQSRDESDDNLPPGFGGNQTANHWSVKLSQIPPLIKWRCPGRLLVNIDWQVVAGEESKEVEVQNQREMRVLEAIYPRPSAIPPNPIALVDVENSTANERNVPVVPVTPIEDDDGAMDTSLGPLTPNPSPMISHPQILSHSTTNSRANEISAAAVEPNMLAAAQAVLTSVLSNNNTGNLIDHDLLVKILSNPKMVEQLATSVNVSSSSSAQNGPSIGLQKGSSFGAAQNKPPNMHNMPSTSERTTKNSFHPTSVAISRTENPLSSHITRPEICSLPMATPNGHFYPPHIPNLRPPPSPPVGAPMVKDINYFKSLIQQHGEEKRTFAHQGNQHSRASQLQHLNFAKSRESKPKIMKPCMYFNSPKGCRNGANCAYQHDTSSQGVSEVHNAKRMKLDREITGA